jgi:6-phosphogluconolactonase (cycloisomerase 2 family)
MLNRRDATLLLAATALPGHALAQGAAAPVFFYASTGPELALYHLDVAQAALNRKGAVTLPANIQYAWPHPSKKYLYVASSNVTVSGSLAVKPGTKHFITTFAVNAANGQLTPLGPALPLNSRPIYISVDGAGHYLFAAYNNPSNVSAHRIRADGMPGAAIRQQHPLDVGIFAHQVRALPSTAAIILVTRGNDATATTAEDPGAIKLFRFQDGQLANLESVAPGKGLGFGPRHLDFHPTLPFVYVSMERERQLQVFERKADGTLTPGPVFTKELLKDPKGHRLGQVSGPIHVSADGRFVYVANRNSATAESGGKSVSTGGENNMAVFAIDAKSGEPHLIQHADIPAFDVRTFTIDPTGRLLIAASTEPMLVHKGSGVATVPASLSLFRIAGDGTLRFVRKLDVDTTAGNQIWCGTLTMA